MNLKASKRGFKKEKYESILLCSLLRHWLSWQFIDAFGLNKKVSCEGLLRRGFKNFKTSLSQWLCRVWQLTFINNDFTWLSFGLWNIYGKDPGFKVRRTWVSSWSRPRAGQPSASASSSGMAHSGTGACLCSFRLKKGWCFDKVW